MVFSPLSFTASPRSDEVFRFPSVGEEAGELPPQESESDFPSVFGSSDEPSGEEPSGDDWAADEEAEEETRVPEFGVTV